MDDVEPAGSPDAARLSPGEIAYREFSRSSDGYDEREVRAFLGEVADAVSAGREREQRLEARVAALEASATGSPAPAAAAPDPRAEALFSQLREAEPVPEPPRPKKPKAKKPPAPPADAAQADATGEPADVAAPPGDAEAAGEPTETPPPAEVPASEPTPDDLLRARRDGLVQPLVVDLVRTSKRLLQDEQNVLLDAARRAKTRVEPSRLLPDPVRHREVWATLLQSAFDAAYGDGRSSGGKTRKPSSAPERVVNELTAALIAPLRERLTQTLANVVAQGPYESPAELHRELASAVSARYREWRATDLEKSLGDVLAAAWARGAFDGAPTGAQLRWVSDPASHCPDCEDNSLEPTVKGQHFPTGQAHPPAHPGCRCLVVAVEADR